MSRRHRTSRTRRVEIPGARRLGGAAGGRPAGRALGQTDKAETRYSRHVAGGRAGLARTAAPSRGTAAANGSTGRKRPSSAAAAIGIRPRYSTALNTLGVALSRSGDHAAAIAALEAAWRPSPANAKAAFNLGQALDQCGPASGGDRRVSPRTGAGSRLGVGEFRAGGIGELPPPARMPRLRGAPVRRLRGAVRRPFGRAGLCRAAATAGGREPTAARWIWPHVDLGCGTGLVGTCVRSCANIWRGSIWPRR